MHGVYIVYYDKDHMSALQCCSTLCTSTNNRQKGNNSKTTTDQSLQLSRFDDQSHHNKTDQSNPNPNQRHKYHHLTTTFHLTLKMTTAQVVETSVTNNSLSKDYPHPDDHVKHIYLLMLPYL